MKAKIEIPLRHFKLNDQLIRRTRQSKYKSFKIYKKSILNHCVYKLTSITVYCISSAVNGNAEPDSELDTVENAFL